MLRRLVPYLIVICLGWPLGLAMGAAGWNALISGVIALAALMFFVVALLWIGRLIFGRT